MDKITKVNIVDELRNKRYQYPSTVPDICFTEQCDICGRAFHTSCMKTVSAVLYGNKPVSIRICKECNENINIKAQYSLKAFNEFIDQEFSVVDNIVSPISSQEDNDKISIIYKELKGRNHIKNLHDILIGEEK